MVLSSWGTWGWGSILGWSRTESGWSSWDFSRAWKVSPKTACLNGRNLVTTLLSGRFPLFSVSSKGSFRPRSKTRDMQGFESCRVSQLSDEPHGVCCWVSTIPVAVISNQRRRTRLSFLKSGLLILLFYDPKGYFMEQVKIPRNKNGKKFHFLTLLPSGFFGDFH